MISSTTPAGGARVAQRVAPLEGIVIDIHAQHAGRVARAAVRHNSHGIEDLKRARGDGNQQEEQLRR